MTERRSPNSRQRHRGQPHPIVVDDRTDPARIAELVERIALRDWVEDQRDAGELPN